MHGRVEADAVSRSEIGSLSDLQFAVHADSKAPEKTAASAGPSQGDLSRSRWVAGVAPSRTRRVQRENARASGAGGLRVGNERWQWMIALSMPAKVQVRIIASDSQPGLPRVARLAVRQLRAAVLDWRRRIGRTIDRRAVCPAGPASSRHYSPSGRELRPAPPRSLPFPCDRAAPCNRPEGNSCPARILPASPRDKNPTDADPRSGTATATLPNRQTRTNPPRCHQRPLRVQPSCPGRQHAPSAP